MAGTTVTSMTEISARLRADDTPTPPASDPAVSDPHDAMDTSSGPSTPTRHSFAGILGQRALPDEQPIKQHDALHSHDHSDPNHHHHHHDSGRADSTQPGQDGQEIDDDIDMGEGDTETVDDEDLSDNESATGEKPSKKKKGQRFFCTDFPPCQLSFTRSEHLARHIRKHTGERPFQCHCSRRFSRLDNLRQHAQTVHVNEEIPGDSLAATSTRFQRQIRTERVRPTSSRSRGATVNNGGQTPTHPRGHSRNLSSSSIGSVTSSFTIPDDRRRPPTLAIATDGLKRPHDMTEDESQYYPQQSGATTPTSAFSTIGSPTYNSAFGSPSRSLYYSGQTHNRRLSVPSTSKPQQQHNAGYASGYYTPISSQASAYTSHQTSGYASPSSSIMSPEGRRDSETEVEYRRRTWHASSHSSYNQRTSGLLFHRTPDEPVPAIPELPPMPQLPRLPGIESFDHAPPVNTRPQADTNMLNAMSRPTTSHDAGIQQGLVKLEISPNGMRQETQWPQAPPQYAPPSGPLPSIPAGAPFNAFQQQQHQYQPPRQHHNHHHHTLSMPEVPATARRNKRQAWYGGPVGPSPTLLPPSMSSHRPSPEDSGSSDGIATPQTFQGQEYHPAIVNSNDPTLPQHEQYRKPPTLTPSPQTYDKPMMPPRADSGFGPFHQTPGPMTALSQQMPHPSQAYPMQAGQDGRFTNGYVQVRPENPTNDMGRLEALVAVATSENRAAQEQR